MRKSTFILCRDLAERSNSEQEEWVPYSKHEDKILAAAWLQGIPKVKLCVGKNEYEVDFERRCQRNMETQTEKPVRHPVKFSKFRRAKTKVTPTQKNPFIGSPTRGSTDGQKKAAEAGKEGVNFGSGLSRMKLFFRAKSGKVFREGQTLGKFTPDREARCARWSVEEAGIRGFWGQKTVFPRRIRQRRLLRG